MLGLIINTLSDGYVETNLEYLALTSGDTNGQCMIKREILENFMAILFLRNLDQEIFWEILVEYRKS